MTRNIKFDYYHKKNQVSQNDNKYCHGVKKKGALGFSNITNKQWGDDNMM